MTKKISLREEDIDKRFSLEDEEEATEDKTIHIADKKESKNRDIPKDLKTKKEMSNRSSELKLDNKPESKPIYCSIHGDVLATFTCPICKKDYCESCKKILYKNRRGLEKIICKKCWHTFLVKTFIFFMTFLVLIILLKNLPEQYIPA